MKYSFFSLISLACFISFSDIAYSQERTCTGKVTTLEKIAIVNAEVKVLSSKEIFLTDTAGVFEVPCSSKDKLKVSAKGFRSETVKINEYTKNLILLRKTSIKP